MKTRFAMLAAGCLVLAGGGCVHKADLDSWEGVPVAALDKHPFFLTLPVVRTMASDGTEIRNYVNGKNIASCSGAARFLRPPLIRQLTVASPAACSPSRPVTTSFTSKTVAFSST